MFIGTQAQTLFNVPTYPYETSIVDYDLDGDNDIVVGCEGANQDPDSIVIFFNDGWGNFESEKFEFPNQIEMHCIDITGDSYPDIVTQTINNIIFYENDQQNGIEEDYIIMNIDSSPKTSGIADINRDGRNDILYHYRFPPYGWGCQFNVDGYNFTDSSFVESNDTWLKPQTGLINNDEHPDILITTVDQSETVHILYNDYPNFEKHNLATPHWGTGYILNIDNDSMNDILLEKPSYIGSTYIVNMINKWDHFRACDTLPYINGSSIKNVCDYDLDGYDDLTWTVYQANNQPIEDSIYIYFNDQNCGYTHAQSVYMGNSTMFTTVDHGDLNGDGYPELVVEGYHFPRDNIRIMWNDGTGHFIDTNSVYVGLPEIKLKDQFQIHPNPAQSQFTVHCTGTIEVYDFFGRLVTTTTVPSGQTEAVINTSNWKHGIYIVKVREETAKVVVN